MLQANELRIGNWIFIGINKEPYQVNARFFSSVANGLSHEEMVKAGCEKLNSTVTPIPLTEEWLLRFGFVKESDNYILNTKPSFMWSEGNDDDLFISFQMEYGCDWASAYHVRYVHQLQNLYFALTGEELTIKND